jgi:uncharacterized protein with PQ loop repeat
VGKKIQKQSGTLYRLTLVAAVVQPLMTVPQVVQLYTTHDASGLSLATWLGYAIIGLVFMAYGIKYRLVPIATTQVIWFVLQISIVIGILMWQ